MGYKSHGAVVVDKEFTCKADDPWIVLIVLEREKVIYLPAYNLDMAISVNNEV